MAYLSFPQIHPQSLTRLLSHLLTKVFCLPYIFQNIGHRTYLTQYKTCAYFICSYVLFFYLCPCDLNALKLTILKRCICNNKYLITNLDLHIAFIGHSKFIYQISGNIQFLLIAHKLNLLFFLSLSFRFLCQLFGFYG